MAKGNEYFLRKTLEEIDIILKYSHEKNKEELYDEPVLLDAIIFRMIQMSEHMNNISDDFKTRYSNIAWNDIKGFRNRLVHSYGSVDLSFVFNAISVDIPKLEKDLLIILKSIN